MLAVLLLPSQAVAHTIGADEFAAESANKASEPAAPRNPATVRAGAATNLTVPVGGSRVRFEVDPLFAGGPAVGRVAATLASLAHGREMNRLTVRIGDPLTMARVCGIGSTACYHSASEAMTISGLPVNLNNAMPPGMVIAHEYGHHLAANRSDAGWSGYTLGGRHWATYEGICGGVRSGRLYPGIGGFRYWDQPGEAFAQSYAMLHYQGAVPWWWSFAEPDQGSYAAILADVADPPGGTGGKWARRLGAGSSRASTTLSTPLDGRLRARLVEPRSGRFDLILRSADGRVLARGRPKRSRASRGQAVDELSYSVCGERSARLEVRRRSGQGKFTVKIQRP